MRFLAILFFSALNANAQQFQVNTALPAKESKILQTLIADAQKALPPLMRKRLASTKLEISAQALEGQVVGHASRNRITLNRRFLTQLAAAPADKMKSLPVDPKYRQSHRTLYALTLGSLIHEISHVYDLKNFQNEEITARIEVCRQAARENYGDGGGFPPFPNCAELMALTTTVSGSVAFMEANEIWKSGFASDTQRTRMNFLETRSPDPYEWTNSREGFAVNMEYFLLDPEFQCRRPTMHKTLSRLLGHKPFPEQKCDPTRHILVTGSPTAETQGRFEKLDASRIYQVDYLYAGKGDAAMSKFGHSMLRLVICAPERAEVSAACLEDIGSHLVVSYRASVEDFQIDNLKGLAGTYPSVLFVLPFPSTIEEYTKIELRELTNLPLRLTAAEKAALVDAIIELQWTYEGKYKFLTNNCADETLSLIRRGLANRHDVAELSLARPDQLFEELQRIGLGDRAAVQNKTLAASKGLYFPSRRAQYETALKTLSDQGLLNEIPLDDYLKTEPHDRKTLIGRAITQADDRARKKAVASLLMLEDLALLRTKNEVFQELVKAATPILKKAEGSPAGPANKKLVESARTVKNMMALFRSPSHLLPKGTPYGIPSQAEVERISSNKEVLSMIEKAKDLDATFEKSLKELAQPEVLKKLEAVKANHQLLLAELRRR